MAAKKKHPPKPAGDESKEPGMQMPKWMSKKKDEKKKPKK